MHFLWCCLIFCLWINAATAKIYDCFLFFNEFEILKIRLEELYDIVDYFVLVESSETQRGNPKPFYFEDNKAIFEKYAAKIIHVKVNEIRPELGLWERENFQRNCISHGLHNCQNDDVIIISDVDEIPRKEVVSHLARYAKRLRGDIEDLKCAVSLQMPIYFFQLNRQTPTGDTWEGGYWFGSVITNYRQFSKRNAQFFRNNRTLFPNIHNGGWHFTWMGGKEQVRKKLISVVEGSDDASHYTDEAIQKMLNDHPAVPLDGRFPKYVLENQQYLRSIGYIADY